MITMMNILNSNSRNWCSKQTQSFSVSFDMSYRSHILGVHPG